jgi:urea transport system substrate-binding protein
MKRWVWAALVLGLAAFLILGARWSGMARMGQKSPIRVGILHSRNGPLAKLEAPMAAAEKLAIDALNASGGVLGRPIEAVEADGQSDPQVFAREAERLIREEKVSVIFGCARSDCRKSVKEVVEKTGHLLIYPFAYEGLEQSPNIVYTGGIPNQQIIPAVTWSQDTLGTRSYFLVGSDTVLGHSLHEILRDEIKGLGGKVVGEAFVPFDGSEFSEIANQARQANADMVISSLEGSSNGPFYRVFRTEHQIPARVPILSVVVSEDDLRDLPAPDMVNDYCVANYFQEIETDANRLIVGSLKERTRRDQTISDGTVTAYGSVRLWAQAVEDAETEETRWVREAILRQSIDAPEGVIAIDRETQHTWRPVFIGKVRRDGLITVESKIQEPLRPVPFPFSRNRQEWEKFSAGLYHEWQGKWIAPQSRAPTTAN